MKKCIEFLKKPWVSLNQIYHKYLESPDTKAYTYKEAKKLFHKFKIVSIKSPLGHGDLLESGAGVRHRGLLQTIARKIWPRKLIKTFLPNYGLGMMITIEKL